MVAPGSGLITVVGDLLEDVVAWIEAPPVTGTDNAARISRSRGGSAANVAVAVAGAGGAVRFVGRVGDDPAGALLTDQLERAGVEVRVQRAGVTGSVIVLVDPSAERTMFPDRGAAAELGPIDPQWLAGTAWLHVPAYGLLTPSAASAIEAAAAVVRSAGGVVTVDLSATSVVLTLGPAALLATLGLLRPGLVFANADEAAVAGLTGGRRAPWTLVIKNGARPVRIVRPDGSFAEVPADPVTDVRDSTGAGDAFAGATLAGLQRGEPLEQACRAGHSAAARVLGTAGAASTA
jgi:sugar/nucleoside kinase (ribokinase family)